MPTPPTPMNRWAVGIKIYDLFLSKNELLWQLLSILRWSALTAIGGDILKNHWLGNSQNQEEHRCNFAKIELERQEKLKLLLFMAKCCNSSIKQWGLFCFGHSRGAYLIRGHIRYKAYSRKQITRINVIAFRLFFAMLCGFKHTILRVK